MWVRRPLIAAFLLLISVTVGHAADPTPAAERDPAQTILAEVKFEGTALVDVKEFLQDASDCAIWIDWDSLKEAGIARDTPVTGEYKKLTTVAILNRALAKAAGKNTKPVAAEVEGIVFVATPGWIEQLKARLAAHATADQPPAVDGVKYASPLNIRMPWLRFKSRPLEFVLDVISDQQPHEEIEVDWDRLKQFGVTKETMVDMMCPEGRTATVLALVLMNAQPPKVRLDYKLVGDKIRITAEAVK